MAIRLTDEFPSRTTPPSESYPDGSYLDETSPNADDGTPLTKRLHDDYEGLKQSILSQAGVTANGQPDSVTNPQILQALLSIIAQERQTSSLSNLYPLAIGTETSLQGEPYGGPGSGIIVIGYPTAEQETIYTVIDGPGSGTINSISASNERVNIDGTLYTLANYVDTIGGNVGDYLGPYAAGLVFNNRTDWTLYQGQSYRLKPSVPLGFTTTGDFNVDINSLQPFDNSQRAEFQADRAEQEADRAETEADRATTQADRAQAEADRAQAEADRAFDEVENALDERNLYLRTFTEMRAMRAQNNEQYAASGDVHFGKASESANSTPINQGLWSDTTTPNVLRLGRASGSSVPDTQTSKTDYPVNMIAGFIADIININETLESQNTIKFPEAPNGTVTYDSATGTIFDYATQTDPKYGNVAPSHNEAVNRAFGGYVRNHDFRTGDDGSWTKSGNVTINVGEIVIRDSSNSTQVLRKDTPDQNEPFPIMTWLIEIEYDAVGSTGVDDNYIEIRNGTGRVYLESGINKTLRVEITTITEGYVWLKLASRRVGDVLTVKSASIRPATDEVVTDRVDMWGFECRLEEVTGFVYPNGLPQQQSTSMDGIPTTPGDMPTEYYSVFDGDLSSTGLGVDYTSASLGDRAILAANPKNNLYIDEDKKIWQFIVFQDTKRGLGNGDWFNINPALGDLEFQQGIPVLSRNGFPFVQSAEYPGVFDDGNGSYYLARGTVPRQNQGAHEPTLNYTGTKRLNTSANDANGGYWYDSTTLSPITKEYCFIQVDAATDTTTIGAAQATGNLASGVSGSRNTYLYFDSSYEGQVNDARLSSQGVDFDKNREESISKSFIGEMRGAGRVLFTGPYGSEAPMPSFYDLIPQVAIIASQLTFDSVFPDGCVGTVIADEQNSSFTYSLDPAGKCNRSSAFVVIGDGVTWSTSTQPVNQAENTITLTVPTGFVALVNYEQLSNFTVATDNLDPEGEYGDVIVTANNEVDRGNRLQSSLIGDIGKETLETQKLTMLDAGDVKTHYPISLGAPVNDSSAVKTLYSIVNKNGQAFLQFNGKELIHDGSDWGDNSEIPIIDGEGTITDDNGNTVKTFCHHSQHPIGWIKNNI